jgi:hypothetical protein
MAWDYPQQGWMNRGGRLPGRNPGRGTTSLPPLQRPVDTDEYEKFLNRLVQGLAEDPVFPYTAALMPLPLVNATMPAEWRPGMSRWTTIDRRLPGWMRPKVNSGAEVSRGTAGRLKFLGRYGTVAAAIGTFAISYSVTASIRCNLESR